MGALHAGHLALIRRARKSAGAEGSVVVSIFVNPTQFGPKEDFSKYPRPLAQDMALCRELGVDALFAPTAGQMYAPDFSTFVQETALETVLCGKARPGHFRGVCTIVSKLFHIFAPDAAVFGEKDFQQLAIIRRMVRDLDFPIKIIGAPIVREADGLALSSRNRFLNNEARDQAALISKALRTAAESGETSPASLRRIALRILSKAPLARIDYLEVVDPEALQPAHRDTHPKLLAAAVFFNSTRLIDNILVP